MKSGLSLLALLFLLVQVAHSQRKQVLVLHSYHQGLQWTDNLNQGLKQGFAPYSDSIEVFYDYLDRKRNLDTSYFKQLEELYALKLSKSNFDLVVVCDNAALEFVTADRSRYFGDIPLVFCGINNYRQELIAGQNHITGIIEEPDISATLDLITRLHPRVKRLYIINDNKTTTALENKNILLKEQARYGLDLQFHFLEDMITRDIRDTLQQLGAKSAVLLLTYNRDAQGRFISYRENGELIPENYHRPVYTLWQFFMADEVIGGKIISGEVQGRKAAKMALRILKGLPADSIPVDTSSLSNYTFNHHALKRHEIDEGDLPPHAAIINAPRSFYTINKKWINTGIAALLAAGVIILLLANAILRRKKAEKSLLEKQQRLERNFRYQKMVADIVALLNSTNDFTQVTRHLLELLTQHYLIGKVSIYRLNEAEEIEDVIASRVSSYGKGIAELNEKDYHKLNRMIGKVKQAPYFLSEDLGNLTAEERDFYQKRKIGAVALFPIRIGQKIFGMAGFAQPETQKWDQREVNEIATIVRMIANAWERQMQMNKYLEAEKKHISAVRMVEKSSRLASIGVMASGITHEVNQPLSALRVAVDSLKYQDYKNPGALPDFVKKKLDTMLKGIGRIDEIIKHMRDFWVAPSQKDETSAVDLTQAIKNAYSLVERQIFDHGIAGKLDVPDDRTIPVQASFIQVEQIIINLVMNAIQALDDTGRADKQIYISARQRESCAILMVSDNATGIPADVGDKLFDPFYSTKKGGEGTGLGLAIVKTFVDRLSGNIQYYNNDEGGATFRISFCQIKDKKPIESRQ